jgi:hypothetical protein
MIPIIGNTNHDTETLKIEALTKKRIKKINSRFPQINPINIFISIFSNSALLIKIACIKMANKNVPYE